MILSNMVYIIMLRSSSLFLYLFFSALIALQPIAVHGEDNIIEDDFLKEKPSQKFDPMEELDSVPRSRIEKKLKQVKSKQKQRNNQIANKCYCVLNPCLSLTAERVYKNREGFNVTCGSDEFWNASKQSCTKISLRDKERERKRINNHASKLKKICYNWHKQKALGEDKFIKQIQALEVETKKELAIEEKLRKQRQAKKQMELEEKIRQAKLKKQRQIAEQERQEQQQREASEAKRLDDCQAAWSKGANPCGCGMFAEHTPRHIKEGNACAR